MIDIASEEFHALEGIAGKLQKSGANPPLSPAEKAVMVKLFPNLDCFLDDAAFCRQRADIEVRLRQLEADPYGLRKIKAAGARPQ